MDEPQPLRQSARKFARGQRRLMSRGETMLWWELRGPGLDGVSFRRQMPLGPYTADFACPARRLVVEVDGPMHGDRVVYDQERDAWMRRQGWRVLRFSDELVIGGLSIVVERIRQALRA